MQHDDHRRVGPGGLDDGDADLERDAELDAEIEAIAPPPRARPAVRPGERHPEPPQAHAEDRADGGPPESASSSRRIRLRPAGLRAPTAQDRRTASGRLAPVSPPHRVPHPRAVSGPPRPAKGDAGQSPAADSSGSLGAAGSGARRKVSSSQSLPAAASGELSLDAVLGDEPILVVDELPAGRLFGEPHGWGRAVRLRLDTLAVAGALGAVLLTVAFLVGRGSGPSTGEGTQVARADTRRGEVSLALGSVARDDPAAVPAPRPPEPPPAAGAGNGGAGSAGASATPPVGAPGESPRIQIRVMTAERSRADAVKAFLEQQGFRVYLDPVNAHTTIVRVGAYGSMTAPDALADLKAIRALSFDRRALKDAYFVPWKAGS